MDEIIEGLFCGDALGAKSKELLLLHKITHVLNVSDFTVMQFVDLCQYKTVIITDMEN